MIVSCYCQLATGLRLRVDPRALPPGQTNWARDEADVGTHSTNVGRGLEIRMFG